MTVPAHCSSIPASFTISAHLAISVFTKPRSSSEVLVSGTVRDLVVGSGLTLLDRGTHALKGVDGEWRIFALDR